MNDRPPSDPVDDQRKRQRAIIRLVLGQMQVVGATVGLYFLVTTGVSAPTIWAVSLTGVVSIVSRCLFKVVWVNKH